MKFTTHKKLFDEDWIEYVPDFANNRSLPVKEMVTCEVHFLNYKEAKKYRGNYTIKGKSLRKGLKFDMAEQADKIFCENVRNFKNVEIDDKKYTRPEDILRLAEGDLVDMIEDIGEAIEDASHLKEGDIKNFGA
jgi:hypothetical protein